MDDRDLLDKLLDNDLRDEEREAFRDMRQSLSRYHNLTPKQRAWAEKRLEDFQPTYENLVSSGKVPRGREVELLVKDKPLRPPPRKVDDG